MQEARPNDLAPHQVAVVESLFQAGFKFTAVERYARYLAVERDGFIALLETADGKIKLFGQVGYHRGEGIAMLVERAAGKAFVWKSESVPATPELLERYERTKADLRRLLDGSAREEQ